MKIKIGLKSIDISDGYIKSFKTKDEFLKATEQIATANKIDKSVLSDKMGEAYDLIVPKEDKKPEKK